MENGKSLREIIHIHSEEIKYFFSFLNNLIDIKIKIKILYLTRNIKQIHIAITFINVKLQISINTI